MVRERGLPPGVCVHGEGFTHSWRLLDAQAGLTRHDEYNWRGTFYTTGMEHSPTSAPGTGWERAPWHATQAGAAVSHALRV
jgi:hypothetical protein